MYFKQLFFSPYVSVMQISKTSKKLAYNKSVFKISVSQGYLSLCILTAAKHPPFWTRK